MAGDNAHGVTAANDNIAGQSPISTGAPRRCPICKKPAVESVRPFCSKRCADVDLHRWLGGSYVVPADHDDETAEK